MRLVIDSRLPEIQRATQLVEEFRARHGLAQGEANAVNVVLDELLSNSIRHGLDGAGAHRISVALEYADGEITIEVEDDGIAFDPTRVSTPLPAGTLAERRLGGLGLAFVRELTDSIEYRRVADRNRLILRRRVVAPASPA
jgi:anti-sigma regulatory factor (Ser/Thr protein kinase)